MDTRKVATLAEMFLPPMSIEISSEIKIFTPEEQILPGENRPLFERGLVNRKADRNSNFLMQT